MALMRNANPENSSGSYERLFGNKELGDLITKIHSTSIANGNELEKMIKKRAGEIVIHNLDNFFENDQIIGDMDATYLIPKEVTKKSKHIDFPKHEPDFLIIKIKSYKKHCHIIELKDGHVFDTKKVHGEKEALQKFQRYVSTKIQYSTSIHICCFNKIDKQEIITGMKGTFSIDEIMTGKEFCDLLFIDYSEIIEKRRQDAKDNYNYFLEQLIKIDNVRKKIKKLV